MDALLQIRGEINVSLRLVSKPLLRPRIAPNFWLCGWIRAGVERTAGLTEDAVARRSRLSAMTQLNSNCLPSGASAWMCVRPPAIVVWTARHPRPGILLLSAAAARTAPGVGGRVEPDRPTTVANDYGIRLKPPRSKLIHPRSEDTIPEDHKPCLGQYLANYGPFQNAEFKVVSVNGFLMLDIPTQLIFELREPDARGVWKFVYDNNLGVSFVEDDAGTVTGLRFLDYGSSAYMPKMEETPVADWILRGRDEPLIFNAARSVRFCWNFVTNDLPRCVQLSGAIGARTSPGQRPGKMAIK